MTDLQHTLFILAREAQRRAHQRLRLKKKRSGIEPSFSQEPSHIPAEHANRSSRQIKGDLHENLAADMLVQAGYTILGRQLHCPFGEIDLVAQFETMLIFVEVRSRASRRFGGAAASVTAAKQRKLLLTAKWWLPTLAKRHFNNRMPPCRIDVIAFEGEDVFWCKDSLRFTQDK